MTSTSNALIFLGLTIIGLGFAIYYGLKELGYKIQDARYAQAKELAYEEAITEDLIRNDLLQLALELADPPAKPNYRHNLHCPCCGRFSARVIPDSSSVMACSKHGMQVRWEEMPIDWAVPMPVIDWAPTVQIQVIPKTMDLEPATGAIDLIFPHDDELELELMGALV